MAMVLIRNKRTGALIEVTQEEADFVCNPENFKKYIKETQDLSKIKQVPIEAPGYLRPIYQMAQADLCVNDILSGCFEIIPNTTASKILYGKGN